MSFLFRIFSFIIFSAICSTVYSHPEDEFCYEGGLDPALCAELASLDAEASPSSDIQAIVIERSSSETFLLYIRLGIEHILPDGIDHLLFIFALILATTALKSLVVQISLFTLAHTITLILTIFGWVEIQGNWIEVLIALSIAFVAIESIFSNKVMPWRYPIIFIFGLLHGLGFSGALMELGLPKDQVLSALIGFNIGVEIGQLIFALTIFLLLFKCFGKSWYRKLMLLPSSVLIALVALFWTWQRIG